MDDKTKWEVEQLKTNDAKQEKEIDELKEFKYTTIEKLKTIFERLRDIENSNRWLGRSFAYLLGGSILTAIMSLIVWLIQR